MMSLIPTSVLRRPKFDFRYSFEFDGLLHSLYFEIGVSLALVFDFSCH